MKTIDIEKLSAGDVFTKPVYVDADNILVKAHVAISATDIERLRKWKIKQVMTDGDKIQMAPQSFRPDYSLIEEKEINETKKKIKDTVNAKAEVKAMLQNGELLVTEFYYNTVSNKPVQTGLLRNLAENIASLIDAAPLLHFYLFANNSIATIENHVMSASIFGALLAKAIGFSKPKQIELIYSMLMMDVGMIKVPVSVRSKTTPLTDAELAQVHSHTVLGYQLLTQVAKMKNSIALVALQHHEHFDGSGYPQKINGQAMSENSRIAAIADAFSALLENKVYRKPKAPYAAMKELLTLGIYRYDPTFLKTFVNNLSIYPIGSVVKMSDDSIGVVVAATSGKPMRPQVAIIRDKNAAVVKETFFIHLLHKTDYFIASTVAIEELGISLEKELDNIAQSM